MLYLLGLAYLENSQIRFSIRHEMELKELLDSIETTNTLTVTRHLIAYPSDKGPVAKKNCSCLEFETENPDSVQEKCHEFFEKEAVGENSMSLFMIPFDPKSKDLGKWARKAKQKKPAKKDRESIVEQLEFTMLLNRGEEEILTASVIATGLRAGGNDGYFIWLPGLDRIKSGIYSVGELTGLLQPDKIVGMDNKKVPESNRIFVSGRIYPVLKSEKKLIYVEPVNDYELYEWETASFNSIQLIT